MADPADPNAASPGASDATPPPAPPEPPSAAAEAALKAAKEAIAAAKTMQMPPAGEPDAAVSAKASAADEAAEAEMMAMMNKAAAPGQPAAPGPQTTAFNMPSFAAGEGAQTPTGLDLLGDVQLHVKIELGRTKMLVEDVLRLGEGSVVELDKLAGDPVDVYVNDRPVARGEVLVLNDNFCVRINEILSGTPEGEGHP
jgi:flagellar motor switch protein FliN/FliY